MDSRRFKKVGQYIHDHRLLALAFLAAMTLFLGFWAMQSKIDNSLDVWQSDNDPHWQQYQKFIEKYKIADPLFIYLPSASSNHDKLLADRMKNIKGVDFVHEIDVEPVTGGKANLISIIPRHGSSPGELSSLLQNVKPTCLFV